MPTATTCEDPNDKGYTRYGVFKPTHTRNKSTEDKKPKIGGEMR